MCGVYTLNDQISLWNINTTGSYVGCLRGRGRRRRGREEREGEEEEGAGGEGEGRGVGERRGRRERKREGKEDPHKPNIQGYCSTYHKNVSVSATELFEAKLTSCLRG